MVTLTKSLSSRLSKRAFWLLAFLITVPISVSAVLAINKLSDQLIKQEREQLHWFGKNFLMSAYWELKRQENHLEQLLSLRAGMSSGELVALFNKNFDRYAVSGPRLYLANGVTRRRMEALKKRMGNGENNKSNIFLINDENESRVWIASSSANEIFAVVALDPLSLWGDSENLPNNIALCVVEESGIRIYCPHEFDDAIITQTIEQSQLTMTGEMRPGGGRSNYIGNYWTLFLKSGFAASNWIVLTRVSKDYVFSPLKQFGEYFLPIIGAIIISSILILLVQVRRNLAPLQSLLEGTRKISKKDFSTRIKLEGEDEFAELAKSFNRMSAQLDRQFLSIEVSAQIDETILSTFDINKVVNLLLVRIFEIFDCNLSSVVLKDEEETNRIYYCLNNGTPDIVDNVSELDLDEIRRLVWFDMHREVPTAVSAVFECVGQQFSGVCVPISVEGTTVGLIILDIDIAEQDIEVVEEVLNDFSQRLAVAKSADEWEERLKYQATHDLLTGLPNRLSFQNYLQKQLNVVGRMSVLFVDLDHFKDINDTKGHSTGDQLLKFAADRLQQAAAPHGRVFRLGGDEFTVIVDYTNEQKVEQFAQHMLELMRAPFTIDSREFLVTASVGVARYPRDGRNGEILLQNADLAMYFAKQEGRNRFKFFHSSMMSSTYCRTVLETDLRKAIRERQFFLMYQPQINIRNQEVVCLEALIRWQHPEHGLTSPSVFTQVAEEASLIADIDKWVLKSVFEQFHDWSNKGIVVQKIAVNVSPSTLHKFDYLEYLQRLMVQYDSKGFLELEITENVFLENSEQIFAILERIKALGIDIALDDFGTGYSSLSYLNKFPIDALKIDQSFVSEISKDKGMESIIQAMIRIANSLDFSVIAEGVENDEQLAFLDKEGCSIVQGFYYSQPMQADRVVDYIDSFEADIPKQASM